MIACKVEQTARVSIRAAGPRHTAPRCGLGRELCRAAHLLFRRGVHARHGALAVNAASTRGAENLVCLQRRDAV